MSSYRGNPRAAHREDLSYRQQLLTRRGRTDLPIPRTVTELDAQLAEIVAHGPDCRWTNSRRLQARSTETPAQAEQRVCTCSAIDHRRHLRNLFTRTTTAAPARPTHTQGDTHA